MTLVQMMELLVYTNVHVLKTTASAFYRLSGTDVV